MHGRRPGQDRPAARRHHPDSGAGLQPIVAQASPRPPAFHHRRGRGGAPPRCSSSPSAPRPTRTGSADLQYVLAVAEEIARHMPGYRVIVNSSTVPVGTARRCRSASRRYSPSAARRSPSTSSPTRNSSRRARRSPTSSARPHPRRHPLGARAERMREIYRPFNRNHERTSSPTCSAELAKYAANAMLATRISLDERAANLAERPSTPTSRRCAGHRRRPAHRLPLHLPRLRLWRLVLPGRTSGARSHRRAGRLRRAAAAGGGGKNSARRTPCSLLADHFGGAGVSSDARSRSGARLQAPTPTTCARPPAAA